MTSHLRSTSPAEDVKPHLLLLPLLAGFLLSPPLQELFGKFFGFQRVPQAGTNIIVNIIWRFHLLEDRYSHGNYGQLGGAVRAHLM